MIQNSDIIQDVGVLSKPGGASGTAVYVTHIDERNKVTECYGTTVPVDAETGYAVGCQFRHTVTGTLYANAGSITSCNFDSVLVTTTVGGLVLATGSMIIGVAGAGAALDIKGNAKIIVGNATTATSVSVSGDVTMDNAGAVTIGAKKVTAAKQSITAAGSIVQGIAGGAGAELAIGTAGQIPVVNAGATALAYVSAAGDVTIGSTGTTAIGVGKVTPVMKSIKAITALADAAATAAGQSSAANLLKGIFSIATLTAPQTFTTPTATQICAAFTGYITGSWFEFTIINNGASAMTVTSDSTVVCSGVMAVANGTAGTFLAIVTGTNAVTIYRK